MKLVDLSPQWIHPNIFMFRCPCSRRGSPCSDWLTCKDIVMPELDQYRIFREWNAEHGHTYVIVGCKKPEVWGISSRDFATMTVSPSIDHSPSGNWHGFIRNGNVE